MATSEVQIMNLSLTALGETRIAAPDQGNKAARDVSFMYPLVRDDLVGSYRWNFAIKRAALAKESTPPAFGFANQFMLPSDCLHVIGVYDAGDPPENYTTSDIPFKVEGGLMLANIGAPAQIFYLKQVTDVAQFDPVFVTALGLALAESVAFSMSNSASLVSSLQTRLNAAIKRARLSDAIEGKPEVQQAGSWVNSRLQGDLNNRRNN